MSDSLLDLHIQYCSQIDPVSPIFTILTLLKAECFDFKNQYSRDGNYRLSLAVIPPHHSEKVAYKTLRDQARLIYRAKALPHEYQSCPIHSLSYQQREERKHFEEIIN